MNWQFSMNTFGFSNSRISESDLEIDKKENIQKIHICQAYKCLKMAIFKYEIRHLRKRWIIDVFLCEDHQGDEEALGLVEFWMKN